MNVVQAQHLFLGSIFAATTVYLAFLTLRPARRTSSLKIAAPSSLLLAAIFIALASADFDSRRAEVAGWMLRELPFTLILAYVCLAQAGALPHRFGAVALEEVARRPRLEALLRTAPLVLVASWLLPGAAGLVWPVPVLRDFSPAPPGLVLLEWALVLPTIFYCALVAWLFLRAARSEAAAPRLRTKNLFAFAAVLAWLLMSLNAMGRAAVRVWVPDGLREAIVGTQLAAQSMLLAVSMIAVALALTAVHIPALGDKALRAAYSLWLHSQGRFEARRWALVKSGRIKGLFRLSHYVTEAAERLGLQEEETQKALTTVQLAAILTDKNAKTSGIDPETAKDLHELQRKVQHEGSLAAQIQAQIGRGLSVQELEGSDSDPLHESLGAALALTGHDADEFLCAETAGDRPLWHYLAGLAVADAGLSREHRFPDVPLPDELPEERAAYRRALKAYEDAKRAILLTVEEG
jgi:hypothetical protein